MTPSNGVTAESAASVHRITQLGLQAMRCSPCCRGATVTAGVPGGGIRSSATHPDLAALACPGETGGDGPVSAALALRLPVASPDLLEEDRWPSFRALALLTGLRSCLAVPVFRYGFATAVTLYAFWPGVLAPGLERPVRVLGEAFIDALVRDEDYASAQLEVGQLRTAMPSRAVIDQASGMVMRAVGCDSEQAFDFLRSISQRTNRKLSEIAGEVVRSRGMDISGGIRRPARAHR